ncbi:hypothetical protein NECAME_09762 [Necator americanus]|uniref:Protein kinase domain-containing protein n=1 Tax=Necator americanus TaxID=51031 RepID=W2TCH9_NECAM|nr:hypothetical protein NECAME_09762 [Necator americanus]ETN79553.1 hypothetical protein NECAME_09762 [Necator americanus]
MRYTGSYVPMTYRRKVRKKSVRTCGRGSSKPRSRKDDQGRAERAEKIKHLHFRIMPRKLSNEPPLTLPRMPIVIIPRKRKYKNYVSRRRNTQLLASLRKCVSDPHLYRSFNHWKELWRGFSPNNQATSPSISHRVSQVATEENVLLRSLAVPPTMAVLSQSSSKKYPLQRHEFKKNEVRRSAARVAFATGRKSMRDMHLQKNFSKCEKSPKALVNSYVNEQKYRALRLPTENARETNNESTASTAYVEDVMKQSLFGAVEQLKNLVPAHQKSAAPSPASFPETAPECGEHSWASISSASRGTKVSDIDFSVVDPKSDVVVPSVPKAVRKAYASKSGTTICAVGSPLNIPTTSNVVVEDQRIIEKKLSLRRRKEQVKENAAFSITSQCPMEIGEKSRQADEQKAKKTVNAVAAAFSTQSISTDEILKTGEKKEAERKIPQQTVKISTTATASLLAQLQLPPTVSAKVDKIIASGRKSTLQNIGDQRARMKAHLDRQAAGVLPDDEDGHLIFKRNDILLGRWELREELGEGTFGRVVKTYDKQRDKMRAVKIVRNVHKYRDAAYLEIKVLTKLKQLDPTGAQ